MLLKYIRLYSRLVIQSSFLAKCLGERIRDRDRVRVRVRAWEWTCFFFSCSFLVLHALVLNN